MKNTTIFTILSLFFVNSAFANHTVCKSGNSERHIEVVSTNAEKGAPCEVKYTKDGDSKVLWKANSDAQFCKTKATGLADQLASSGWKCDAGQEHADKAATKDEAKASVDQAAQKTDAKMTRAERKAQRKAEKEKRKAQREAEKAKRKADQEAAKAEKAKKDAEAKVSAAKVEAKEVKAEAKAEAKQIKADAKTEAKEIKAEAKKETETKKK